MAAKKSARATKKKSRIFWALDAFSKDGGTANQVEKAISAFTSGSETEVLPGYVLDFISGKEDRRVTAQLQKAWKSEFVPLAKNEMERILSNSKLPALAAPRIFVHGTNSKRQSAEFLIREAKKAKCEMIALSTHGRKGLSRLVLGSFAETLVTTSELPLLVVNPSTSVSDRFRTVLFPTDFSANSKKGFDMVLKKAKSWNAKIILFHKYFSPVEPVMQTGVYMLGGGWVPTAQFLETEEKSKREVAQKWIGEAARNGVTVEFVTNHPDLAISTSICETAKVYDVDLIAMVNQTGRWASVVLGSVTREVLRDAPVPIWVMHLKT